ncbi:ATP-binding cassette domain-containing protein [Streptomyces sp. NPDC000594]|uniref:ATP-binding cassette domain-containing protein n=1 Tax=Streptomyces sp. NPDC000594 TaxID=3154261 RepID=UPI0033275BA6
MLQAIGLSSRPRRDLPPTVSDLSFHARPGRITTLLGAGGAGKSTALRLLLGLEPGRGTTLFRGRPLHRIGHPAREVGALLGDVPGHPARTVRGQLRMVCAAVGAPPARAEAILATLGLTLHADRRLDSLGLGTDRRLGLGCALLADPVTLVLDEVTDGLPHEERAWWYTLLRAHADRGGTVLCTTADAREAARFADRILVVEAGRLIADEEAGAFARTRLGPRVAVRTPHAARLAELLHREARARRRPVRAVAESGGALSVYGSSCAEVGETAFRHRVLLHRLADETGAAAPLPAPPQAAPAPPVRPEDTTPPEAPAPAAPTVRPGGTAPPEAPDPEPAPPEAPASVPPVPQDRPPSLPGSSGPSEASEPPLPPDSPDPPDAPDSPGPPDPLGPEGAVPGRTGTGRAEGGRGRGPGVGGAVRRGRASVGSRGPGPLVRGPVRPLRYELLRMFGVRTAVLVMAAAVLGSLALCLLLARSRTTPLPLALAGWPAVLPLPPAALAAGLLGALSAGEEHRRPALATVHGPPTARLRLLLAKALVTGAAAVLTAGASAAVCALAVALLYGLGPDALPDGRAALLAGWCALCVGCAWAGLLAAGIFRVAAAGFAAVLAVPVLAVPAVRAVIEVPSPRSAAGFPGRLLELPWITVPERAEGWLTTGTRLFVQPVGVALLLSLSVLICAYMVAGVRRGVPGTR